MFIKSCDKHYVQEDDLEPGSPLTCQVVVDERVQLSPEEIAEAKQKAMERIQQEQIEKLRKPTTPKKALAQPVQQASLFDF
jgi:hypothetical protein